MKTMIKWGLLLWAAMLPAMAVPVRADEGGAYTVGVVPQFDTRRIIAIWQPLLAEVERLSGVRLRLKMASSISEFERELHAGRFDFAYMNPYHMLKAHDSQGYRPLLRDHGRQLQGILVVHKDSPIQELTALEGKKVVFPAPNALGASLMIRAELQGKRGIGIAPQYVKSHSSVYLNVVTGLAAAGGGVQKTLNAQPPEVREQLRVLYRTAKVAPHPLAVHPRVAKEVAGALTQALLQLAAEKSGQQLLGKIPVKQLGEARLEEYTPLNDLQLDPYYVKD